MRASNSLATAALLAVAVVLAPAATQAREDGWVGKRVITKSGVVLKASKPATGKEKREPGLKPGDALAGRVYRVGKVDGSWLWLVAEEGSARGWVRAEQAVLLESAVDHYAELVRTNPSPGVYNDRGLLWSNLKDYDKAILDFDEAVRLAPKVAGTYYNRGNAWAAKGEHDKAVADYGEALRLDPEFVSAYVGRGIVHTARGDSGRAVADYGKAIRLDPKNAFAYCSRGNLWAARGEYGKALADYGKAIRLDPNDPSPHNGRAWILATCPDTKVRDGKRAVESATKACELSGQSDPFCFDTLAAAYAERGDYDAAVKTQTKALQLIPADTKDREELEARLALYKDKKPYHEEKK